MHHYVWLIFVFLVEMGFYHVGQAGLKLLTSSDPPALTSQRAGISGMSHCVWSVFIFHLIVTILMGTRWNFIVILICIFLVIGNGEHLFMYLLAICIPFFEKYLFKSFARF